MKEVFLLIYIREKSHTTFFTFHDNDFRSHDIFLFTDLIVL
jgi:hypothetical protein